MHPSWLPYAPQATVLRPSKFSKSLRNPIPSYPIKPGVEGTSGIADTDQVNSTFKGFSQLNVTVLDIGDNIDNIDQRKFDSMIDMIESCEDEQNFIIDNGASTFIPICSYIKENDIFSMLNEKHDVIVHSIVTGGQGISDTVNGLHSLISNFNITLIVWLNRYFGEIKYEGKEFSNSRCSLKPWFYGIQRDRVS
ncbi:MAG: hypothetical protein PHI97_34785 [Desulfobulbus sp.]|nr:hypothetical protein [Desulfobulbus sp.]